MDNENRPSLAELSKVVEDLFDDNLDAARVFRERAKITPYTQYPAKKLVPRLSKAPGKRKAKPAAAASAGKMTQPAAAAAKKNSLLSMFKTARSASKSSSPAKKQSMLEKFAAEVKVDDGSSDETSEEGKEMEDNAAVVDDDDDDDDDETQDTNEDALIKAELAAVKQPMTTAEKVAFVKKKRAENAEERRIKREEKAAPKAKISEAARQRELIRTALGGMTKDDPRRLALKRLARKRAAVDEIEDDNEMHHDEDEIDLQLELEELLEGKDGGFEAIKDILDEDPESIMREHKRLRRIKAADFEASLDETAAQAEFADSDMKSRLDGYELLSEEMEKDENAEAASSSKADALSNTDTRKSAVNANKGGFVARLLASQKKPKKKPAAAAAASSGARFTVTEEDLQPELYHRRSMPPSVLEEFEKGIDNTLRDVLEANDVQMDETDQKNCRRFCEVIFSAAAMDLDAVINPKDFGPTEESAAAPFKVLRGDYSKENLRAHKKHSTWWTSEALRYTRKLAAAAETDDGEVDAHVDFYKGIKRPKARKDAENAVSTSPKAVRPIDFAYSVHEQRKMLEVFPENMQEYVYANFFMSLVAHDLYKTRAGCFKVTAADIAAIKKNPRVKEWRCAVTGREIKEGNAVIFLCSAPTAIEDEAERRDRLRKAFDYKAFSAMGIKEYEQLQKSEFSRPERQYQPVCAYVLQDYDDDDDDDDEEMSQAAPEVKMNGHVESKKRAADSEGDEASAKRAKKSEAPATTAKAPFVIVPVEIPESVNYETPTCGDGKMSYGLQPVAKVRDLIASQHDVLPQICDGARIFITPQALAALRRLDQWLFDQWQFNDVSDTPTDEKAYKMLHTLMQPWDYKELKTAGMVDMKLNVMSTAEQIDPRNHRKVTLFDKQTFEHWMGFILSCFVHPNEAFLLSPKQIQGYDRASVLAHTKHKLAIGEVPFGRALTENHFLLQFVRMVLDAVYERVLRAARLRQEGRNDEADDALPLSTDKLWQAIREEAAEEKTLDSDEYMKRYINGDAAEWRGNLKKKQKDLKQFVVEEYKRVREQFVNKYEMPAEVEKLQETKMFLSHLFKRHY